MALELISLACTLPLFQLQVPCSSQGWPQSGTHGRGESVTLEAGGKNPLFSDPSSSSHCQWWQKTWKPASFLASLLSILFCILPILQLRSTTSIQFLLYCPVVENQTKQSYYHWVPLLVHSLTICSGVQEKDPAPMMMMAAPSNCEPKPFFPYIDFVRDLVTTTRKLTTTLLTVTIPQPGKLGPSHPCFSSWENAKSRRLGKWSKARWETERWDEIWI